MAVYLNCTSLVLHVYEFPQYRWFTFRDLRGLSEKEFANSLRDCFLSVWIDDHSGFGTFPLESMKSNVPVIGKVPNLSPDWMSEDNGIWVTDQTLLPDLVADYAQNWLEDNIDPQIYEKMLGKFCEVLSRHPHQK